MTQARRQALVEAVSPAFVERDRVFHDLTGRLAEAVRAGERERQHELYARMPHACTVRDARYAANRFPGLEGERLGACRALAGRRIRPGWSSAISPACLLTVP